ncbi:hypothetical protein HYFRA_00000898 [Hymenoscyphus fraxineus]|uniref:ATP-dependent (S)-NAD(P)H-hydrate dehydratase n=1 Tax=Hymenoscyphus fraxineus TaxID=746836 RepID=A0A9N9PGS9_9HELO|nr:hypothetical protein HYFRA_00000898 [Hymenoscyphus fraxineus]
MSQEDVKMSKATRDTLLKVRKLVPPMLAKFHKGQMGRIAVIGGSEDYTGAPYFSAIASAKLGADMVFTPLPLHRPITSANLSFTLQSHVICEPQAAQVIKTYSPNLMVHPLMRQSTHATGANDHEMAAKSIIDMLPRLHVLVIGPGLGRDKMMQDTCAMVIEAARKKSMPIVLDADGLNLAQTRPELVQGYRECVLTPNVVEFGRLCKSKGIDPSKLENGVAAEKLAVAFGGVTIVQKGKDDYISNGDKTYVSDIEGGLKRSGGQGDTLTGSLGTFLCWRKAYLDKLWDHEGDLDDVETLALAAFGGSAITRESSRLAFAKKGRSLQASDLTEEVHVAFLNLLDEAAPKL